MSTALPELIPHDHPESQVMVWSELEMQAIRKYAQAAIAADRAARGVPVARFPELGESIPSHRIAHVVLEGARVPGAKLYTAPADRGVPDGYALVPIEPTEEMLNLLWLELGDHPCKQYALDAWHAAISAAPTQPKG